MTVRTTGTNGRTGTIGTTATDGTDAINGRIGTTGPGRARRPRSLMAAGALTTALLVAGFGTADAAVDPYYTPTAAAGATVLDGRVESIVTVGGRVLLGGTFTSVRDGNGTKLAKKYLVALNASTGRVDQTFTTTVDKRVRTLAVDSSGRVYVGGDFATIGGASRARVARLSGATLKVDPAWRANANGAVFDLAVDDAAGRVYLGGAFSTVAAASASRLAAVNTASGARVTSWKASANATVRAVAVVPGASQVVVGGDFRTVNGTSRSWLALLNGSGGLAPGQPDPASSTCVSNSCQVLDVAVGGGRIVAAMGGAGNRVVAWRAGTAAPVWAKYGDGDPQVVKVSGATVWVGGHFNPQFGTIGSTQTFRSQLVALDLANGATRPYAPLVEGRLGIFALEASGSALRIAGEFTRVNKKDVPGYVTFKALASPGSADRVAPGAPTATTVKLAKDASGGTFTATVSWSAPAGGAASYRVIKANANGTSPWYGVTTGTKAWVSGIPKGANWVLRVQAVDAAGNVSLAGAPVTVVAR